MNSDKAATVRDSINGCPSVAHDPDPSANYSDGPTRITHAPGPEAVHTGPAVKLKGFAFAPARIEEAGRIARGDAMRPCYEVLLQPLSVPHRPLPSVSIPSAIVHEVAKHDCLLRVEAGYRGTGQPGTIHVRNDFAHEQHPDADGDRCPDCRCTRFRLRDGRPQCERCGTQLGERPTEATVTLEDYA